MLLARSSTIPRARQGIFGLHPEYRINYTCFLYPPRHKMSPKNYVAVVPVSPPTQASPNLSQSFPGAAT